MLQVNSKVLLQGTSLFFLVERSVTPAMDKAGDGRKRYVMAKPEAAYAALF